MPAPPGNRPRGAAGRAPRSGSHTKRARAPLATTTRGPDLPVVEYLDPPPPQDPEASDAIACGPLWISPDEMCEVRIAGHRVPMSLCHLRMLACLLEAHGRVVTREELYRAAGAEGLPEGSRRVDVHVTRIRQALGSLGRHLVAVRRKGYRLDAVGLARQG